VSGRLVRTLVDGVLPAAEHSATWRGRDDCGRRAPSGAYYARLAWEGGAAVTRMTLVK
jgi:flagellar hook assembly protein FlgD